MTLLKTHLWTRHALQPISNVVEVYTMVFEVRSPAFAEGSTIPRKYKDLRRRIQDRVEKLRRS